MQTPETISLDKTKQRNVVKQTNKLKKQIKSGRITVKEKKQRKSKTEEKRGLIYISHLPHGFYEDEIRRYFTQFGDVLNVKVCRSRATGNSKGFGYVEFSHPTVAKIAAESMNNYVMFKKRLTAEFVSPEKRPKFLFRGKQSMPEKFSKQRKRRRQIQAKNKKIDASTHLKKSGARVTRLQNRLQKLKDLGIDYDLKPTDIPEGLEH